MRQYQDLLRLILDTGTLKGDRTGTGTKSVFGHQMRFDLNSGFPIVTTKKTFLKGTIQELLWFISGSTDVTVLQNQGVQFWNSWVDENNTIGPGYGRQMRRIDYITPVLPKIFEKPKALRPISVSPPEMKYDSESGKFSWKVGEKVRTKSSGLAVIVEEIAPPKGQKGTHWKVVFPTTGGTKIVAYRDLLRGNITDNFARTFFGIGYLGNYNPADPHLQMLLRAWERMLRNCYGQKMGFKVDQSKNANHVSDDWHSFETFQKEVKKIPGWELKLEYPSEYALDKDILWASNRYGKDTCIWASRTDRRINSKSKRFYQAKNPLGSTEIFSSLIDATKRFGLSARAIKACLKGSRPEHRGWTEFQEVSVPTGHVLRYRRIDQLEQTIASIKHNPDSRRHIISLWNIHDVDRMMLPPCHGNMIQFYVADGKLSCQMYQRSADVFLGLPVNIASYALFTHMIAQECGLGVGELVITLGDAHLYLNHLEQARECLQREPRSLPKLILNPDIKRVVDFKLDDCKVDGYDPHPHIKGSVSV